MSELMSWLMSVTGWSMGAVISAIVMVSSMAITLVPKLLARLKYRSERARRHVSSGGEQDIINLIQQHAPGAFSPSELAEIRKLSQQFPGQLNESVAFKRVDMNSLVGDDGNENDDQILHHLDDDMHVEGAGETKVADNVSVKVDHNVNPVHLFINGKVIDLSKHIH